MSIFAVFVNKQDMYQTRTISAIPRVGEGMYLRQEFSDDPQEPELHQVVQVIWYPPIDYTKKLTKYTRNFDVMVILDNV